MKNCTFAGLLVSLTAWSYTQAPYSVVEEVNSTAVPLPVLLKRGDTMSGMLMIGPTSGIVLSNQPTLHPLQTNGSGVVVASSVTATELDTLSGVTANVQGQVEEVWATMVPMLTSLQGATASIENQVLALQGATTSLQTQVAGLQAVTGSYLPKAGGAMTGPLTLAGDPTVSLEAATKGYVDNLANGLSWKQAVDAASTGPVALSGAQIVDGVTTTPAMRVLVKNQADASQNGIYLAAVTAWTRSPDANTGLRLQGAAVFVDGGATNTSRGFYQTVAPVTLGSTNLSFVQNFGSASYLADESTITLGGNIFSVRAGGILDNQVGASAAVARNKLATGIANRTLVNDSSGNIAASSVSDVELGYLVGTSASVQAQLDARQAAISTLQAATANLQSQTATNVSAIAVLQGATTSLQAAVLALQGATTTLQGQATANTSAIGFLQGATTLHTAQIAALQGTTSVIEGMVAALQGATTTHTSQITALQGATLAQAGQISALQSATAAINTNVAALQGVTGSFVRRVGDTMTGGLGLNYTGANPTTVPILDSTRKLVSSTVTPTELAFLSGATAAIQAQLNPVSVIASRTTALNYSSSGALVDMVFNIEDDDTANAFDGTTFTAPVAGRYLVTTSFAITAGSGLLASTDQYCEITIALSAGTGAKVRVRMGPAGAVFNCSAARTVLLAAGATLKVQTSMSYAIAPTTPALFTGGADPAWNWVTIQKL